MALLLRIGERQGLRTIIAPFLFWLASRLGTDAPLKLCGIQMAAVFVIAFPFAYVYARIGSIIIPIIFFHV